MKLAEKKNEEFWLAKIFRNLPFVVYLIFAYPTLSFSFRKKSILFKSTFVKRRGIFDHSSQDGILWHAKKVTNIINCIRFVASLFASRRDEKFVKSQRYTGDQKTTCRYCSHRRKNVTSIIVFIRFDLEMQ